MERRLQDVSWRRIECQFDLIELQAERFPHPQTGAREQPEHTG